MKSLNFLFQEDRQALQRAYQELRFQHTSLLIVLSVGLISGLVWGTNQLLHVRIQQLDDEIQSTQQTELVQQTTAAESKVREFNTLVKFFSEETELIFPLSDRVAEISKIIPTGIKVDQLSLNMNAKQLTLAGSASNRDSYLSLRDALANTGWFESVELPITDLLSRENIRFTLQTDLTDEFFNISK
ncbi:MAG: PilN domain-containing protein [Candidatus Nomurabacteria bacterium]|nr:MAG: PilN domain-containing protein [Candidatus Nomurabacteria bacterium]